MKSEPSFFCFYYECQNKTTDGKCVYGRAADNACETHVIMLQYPKTKPCFFLEKCKREEQQIDNNNIAVGISL